MDKQFEVSILNNTASTIQHLKNQQWRISHYTLLIYAALYAVDLKCDFIGENVALIAIALITAIASQILNEKLNISLNKHRKNVEKIYKENKKQIESYGIPIEQKDDYLISRLLFSVSLTGFLITTLLIAFD